MELKHKVLNFIHKEKMITPGSMVMVGVSGGADSIALTYLLHQLQHELSVNLHILHFNHRLRKSSDRDQKLVEQLALRLNLPITIGSRPRSKVIYKASEDKARQWRYDFFVKCSKRLNSDILALAHTSNDQAETVLMRLLRGSGLSGLRGILPKRQIQGLEVVRPLIEIARTQIEQYNRTHRLKYCLDETNASMDFLRNKVRLELLPYLAKKYNPNITNALVDLSKSAADDYDFLQAALSKRIKENLVKFEGRVKIKIRILKSEHPSMRRLMMRYAYEQLTGDLNQLSFKHICDVEDLITSRPSGSIVHWPKQVKVLCGKNDLEFTL